MSDANQQPEDYSQAVAPNTVQSTELEQQLQRLWSLTCGLGIAFLIVAVVFGVFVGLQNLEFSRQIKARAAQTQELQKVEKQWMPALQELARYSSDKPELQAIFNRYGMQWGTNALPAAATQR